MPSESSSNCQVEFDFLTGGLTQDSQVHFPPPPFPTLTISKIPRDRRRKCHHRCRCNRYPQLPTRLGLGPDLPRRLDPSRQRQVYIGHEWCCRRNQYRRTRRRRQDDPRVGPRERVYWHRHDKQVYPSCRESPSKPRVLVDSTRKIFPRSRPQYVNYVPSRKSSLSHSLFLILTELESEFVSVKADGAKGDGVTDPSRPRQTPRLQNHPLRCQRLLYHQNHQNPHRLHCRR
jgi:hypothetical protein